MKILAFDPGGCTGFAGYVSDMGIVMQDQIPMDDEGHHDVLWTLLELTHPDVIVYESFTTWKAHVSAEPVEYIGVLKLWGLQHRDEVTLVSQSPQHGKSFWTDAKLKKARLYKPSLQHAMDATRHLLTYITFNAEPVDPTYLRMLH